jgi:Flp pilus assembly protein TadG
MSFGELKTRMSGGAGRSHGRRGSAVVETAVMAPLMLAMMLGMTEMGSAFLVRQTMTNAAREGARVASMHGATAADVTAAVANTMSGASLTPDAYTVNTNLDTLTSNDTEVWVEVTLPFNRATFTGGMFGGGSFNLHAKSSMRLEGAAQGSGGGITP